MRLLGVLPSRARGCVYPCETKAPLGAFRKAKRTEADNSSVFRWNFNIWTSDSAASRVGLT